LSDNDSNWSDDQIGGVIMIVGGMMIKFGESVI